MKRPDLIGKGFFGLTAALLLLSSGFSPAASGSEPAAGIPVHEFITAACRIPDLSFQRERITYLESTSDGVSYFDDPEVRVSVDRFDKSRQTYALRLKPRGAEAVASEKRMHKALLDSEKMQLDSLLHMELKRHYTMVIDFIYVDKMLGLSNKLEILLDDFETVLKKTVDTPDFDPEKLADVEKDRFDLQAATMKLKSRHRSLCEQMKLKSGTGGPARGMLPPISLDTREMVGIDDIYERVSGANRAAVTDHALLRHASARTKAAEAAYQMRLAQDRKLFSFIQASYDTEDKDKFEKAFSLELGISIPITSGNRIPYKNAVLQCLKNESERQSLALELNQALSVSHRAVIEKIREYDTLKGNLENGFSHTAFNRLLQLEGTDPLILLKLKKTALENEMTLSELSRSIYLDYIDFLHATGKLSQRPLVDYLSARMAPITE